MSRITRSAWSAIAVVALALGHADPAAPPHIRPVEETLLAQVGLASDTPSLIAWFERRSPSPEHLNRVAAHIEQLGAEAFAERERASKILRSLEHGGPSLALLEKGQRNLDPEIARRCSALVRKARGEQQANHAVPVPVARCTARLLVRRRVKESVSILLRYLPFNDDPGVEEETYHALNELGFLRGKVHPALDVALADSEPSRRAAAACVLGWRGDERRRTAVRKLLADPDANVRLRSAQGLLAGRDATGISALISLLEKSSLEIAWQAEELLHYAAAGTAPKAIVGAGSDAARAACRAAWERWRQDKGGKVDWDTVDDTTRRPTLLVIPDQKTRLRLVGCDGRKRYEMLMPELSTQWLWLPKGGLVVVQSVRYVAEYDVAGKQRWQVPVDYCDYETGVQLLGKGRVLLDGPYSFTVIEGG